jgi:hypothetical protein
MNYLILAVVVVTIGLGCYVAYNIDDSIGGINDYCHLNRLGFVNDVNCTVWNKYYANQQRLVASNYKVVEYCDQHNVTGWRSMKDVGLTGFASFGSFDCQAIREYDHVDPLRDMAV